MARLVDPLVGQTLGGAYRVLDRINPAPGPDGVNYQAERVATGEPVTVRVIAPHLARDATAAAFAAAVLSGQAVRHPNVVRVLDSGRGADGRFYVVTEPVSDDLETLLASHRALPPRRVVDLGLQVLAGLGAVHARGIVHGGLCAETIHVDPAPQGDRVRITAFSFVDRPSSPGRAAERSVVIYGAPSYLALDALLGREPDVRSDLHGVASALFEAVTAERAYDQHPTLCALWLCDHREGPDPRVRAPELPEAFARVLIRALAREPADRFQTAAEMAAALEASVPRGVAER